MTRCEIIAGGAWRAYFEAAEGKVMDTNTLATVSAVEIETFRTALVEMLERHHVQQKNHGDAPGIEIMPGKKFARIVRTGICERSAYGFIDLANGDLLKADGWKQPAKGKRGNIRDGLLGCTPHGMVYHR